MYKFGKVSYINALPLFALDLPAQFELEEGIPASMNAAAMSGRFDAAVISRWRYVPQVAREYALLPDFCIGGDGEIYSVKLFSKIPLERLDGGKIFITDESGTSTRAFAHICAKKYGFDFYKNRVPDARGADAVFLIGDGALAFLESDESRAYPYQYDLGEMWKSFAPVPMIYAVIVVRRGMFAELSRVLSDYFDSSLSAFRADPEKYFPRAKSLFKKSAGREISDALLGRYYGALKYKFPADTFARTIRYVDENADL